MTGPHLGHRPPPPPHHWEEMIKMARLSHVTGIPVGKGLSATIGSPTGITYLDPGRSCFPRKRAKNGMCRTNKNGSRSIAKHKHIPRNPVTTVSYSKLHFCCTDYVSCCVRSWVCKDKWDKAITLQSSGCWTDR